VESTGAGSADGFQIADKLIGSLRDILSKVSFEVERSYQVNRLRVEITAARRRRDRLLRSLGEKVYLASQQAADLQRKFQSEVTALDSLGGQIAAKEGEIDELNARVGPVVGAKAGPSRAGS